MEPDGPPPGELRRSSRDLELVREGLRRSLAVHRPGGSDHQVGELGGTSATGMSSETLLFDGSWMEDGATRCERLVARVAPSEEDVPVFPTYDMTGQFATIKTVAELTDVAVPPALWCETDPSVIGSPFFVMGRVEGDVPPDVMPYNFGDSWLFDASRPDQARLQDATVGVLARLHAVEEPEIRFPHLLSKFVGPSALRRHVAGRWDWYRYAARDVGRSDLVERGFAWLDDHWPAQEAEAVLCWGDSRIGNVMYRDFEPVAVLDWEMAGLAPPETDLAWLVYLHRMFEDLASQLGLAGMPHFLREEDVASAYERLSGRTPRDLHWYSTYAAVQLGIVYLRTGYRQVRFGVRAAPDHPDELLLNAPALAQMIGA